MWTLVPALLGAALSVALNLYTLDRMKKNRAALLVLVHDLNKPRCVYCMAERAAEKITPCPVEQDIH